MRLFRGSRFVFRYARIYTCRYVQQSFGADGSLGSSFRAKFETGGTIGRQDQTSRTRDKWHTEVGGSTVSGVRSGVEVSMMFVCFRCSCFVIFGFDNLGISDYSMLGRFFLLEDLNHETCQRSFLVDDHRNRGNVVSQWIRHSRSAFDEIFKAREAFAGQQQMTARISIRKSRRMFRAMLV